MPRHRLSPRVPFPLQIRLALVAALTVGTALSLAATAASPWWEPLREIEAKRLRQGKWKKGLDEIEKLTERILGEAWHDPELRQVLADLSLYRAVAEVNLGHRDDGVCYWHAALNLDARRTRETDLAPYGDAERVFREAPLRDQGKIPPAWEKRVRRGPFRISYEPPREIGMGRSWLLRNDGAKRDRHLGVFEAEVLIDEDGRVHQPVAVTAGHQNPVLVFAALDSFCREGFEPARGDGEPIAVLTRVTINLRKLRWDVNPIDFP